MFLSVKEPKAQSAILVDRSAPRRDILASLIADRDFSVSHQFPTAEAALSATEDAPDLAVYHTRDALDESLDEIATLTRLGVPLLVLTDTGSETIPALIEAGADHVVPLGITNDRIAAGILAATGVRTRICGLTAAVEKAEQALLDARRVQRAKGILMTRHGITETEAHRRVQALSMEKNLALADTAQAIIEAESLLA